MRKASAKNRKTIAFNFAFIDKKYFTLPSYFLPCPISFTHFASSAIKKSAETYHIL